MFVFLPWLSFWNQGGSRLPDQAQVRVAVSADCTRPGRLYRVTLARTAATRARGLSARALRLAGDEGMLFAFDPPERASFWMKGTLIPLQLAYFDANGRLSSLHEMRVEADPQKPELTYPSSGLVAAAIELAPGSVEHQAKTPRLCAEIGRPRDH